MSAHRASPVTMSDAALFFQVNGDAALVGVQMQEQSALFWMAGIAWERANPARAVSVGRFDLDNVRAEIGQKFGAIGAGDIVGEIEDLQASQRSVRHSSTSCRFCSAVRYNCTNSFDGQPSGCPHAYLL